MAGVVDKAPKIAMVERHERPAVAPRSRMVMGPQDFKRLESMVDVYSVHPDVMELLYPSQSVREHVGEVRQANTHVGAERPLQNEFLLVKFKAGMDVHGVAEAAGMLHKIRGKDAVTHGKAEGLKERGFMLVHESNAILIIRRMMSKAVHDTSPINTVSL